MIDRDKQTIKNDPTDAFGPGTTIPLLKLSATMVDLSLRGIQRKPLRDISATFPGKTECHSAEAKVELISRSSVGTGQAEKSNAAQFHRSQMFHASLQHLRISASRMIDQCVRIYVWLRTRTRIPSLLQNQFRCMDCGAVEGHRLPPHNFFEKYLCPVFLQQPVRCDQCARKCWVSPFTVIRGQEQQSKGRSQRAA